MNVTLFRLTLAVTVVAAGLARAAEPRCPAKVAKTAEERASAVRNWDDLYSAYRRFAKCDDGSIGEAFSDSVGRLLAAPGGGLKRLFALTRDDAQFEQFVLRHIDETVPRDVLAGAEKNARERCPTGAKRLCAAIQRAAAAP